MIWGMDSIYEILRKYSKGFLFGIILLSLLGAGCLNLETEPEYTNEYYQTSMYKIDTGLYSYYKNQNHYNVNLSHYTDSKYDDQVISDIVRYIRKQSKSDDDCVYNIIKYVQSIPYVEDKNGEIKYPIETILEGGDCEDTAILAAVLIAEAGYDVIILEYPTHAAIGLYGHNIGGTYYPYNGRNYYYVETTAPGWRIGQQSVNYSTAKIHRVY